MKRNQFSIVSVIVLGGLMACAPLALAQDTATPPPAAQGADTPTAPAPARGAAIKDALAKLNLTPEQKQQITAALKERRDKISALQADGALTPQERRPKVKEIADATEAKIKAIMTPEQYAKWETVRPRLARPGGGKSAGAAQDGSADTNNVPAPKPSASQN